MRGMSHGLLRENMLCNGVSMADLSLDIRAVMGNAGSCSSAFTSGCWHALGGVGQILGLMSSVLLLSIVNNRLCTSRGTGMMGRNAVQKHVVSASGRALPNTSVCVRGLGAKIVDSMGNFCAFTGLGPKACAMGMACIKCTPMRVGVAVPRNGALRESIVLGRKIRLRRVMVNNTFRKRHHTVGSRGDDLNVGGMISTSRMNGFPSSGVKSTLGHVSNVGMRCSRNRTHFKRMHNASTSLDSIAVGNGHVPSTRKSAHGMRLSLVPTSVVRAVRIDGIMASSVSTSTVNKSVGLIAGGSPCGQALATATNSNCG